MQQQPRRHLRIEEGALLRHHVARFGHVAHLCNRRGVHEEKDVALSRPKLRNRSPDVLPVPHVRLRRLGLRRDSKNPLEYPAGKLVDELGLKETRVGGARVSSVHGNFIVNDGNATAADVLALIEKIKAVARERRGIELETEVQILGEP